MTLAEIVPVVRALPALEKRRLVRILLEDINADIDIFPLKPDKLYYLPTPYHSFGVGKALMDAMVATPGAAH